MAARPALLLAALLALAATAAARPSPAKAGPGKIHPLFNVSLHGPGAVRPSATFGISYHGGRLLTNPINVYLIFYGGQWTTPQKRIIVHGINSFSLAGGGSPDMTEFWAIDTGYYNGANAHVSATVTVAGRFLDAGSYGTSGLSDTTIRNIVVSNIAAAGWPQDSTAMYYVLTSSEVTVSGFCSSFCGYHGNFVSGGVDLLYAHSGDATTQCPNGCQPQFQPTSVGGNGWIAPNGDNGADALMSVVAHEISECASDADVDGGPYGWYDNATGDENADYCAYKWGATFVTPNGGRANHYGTNGRTFLVQKNYSLRQGACVISGP